MMNPGEVQSQIGTWLAAGATSNEIVATLQEEEYGLSEEEAVKALRHIYDSWQQTSESLELKDVDTANWHVYLRMQLLAKALGSDEVTSQRLALSVLDSLAEIQSVGGLDVTKPIPLTIKLIPKEEKENGPEGRTGKGDVTVKAP